MKVIYIHGYGSTGQAYKAQLLKQMLPECEVVSPTFDYDSLTPYTILDQLRALVESERPAMIMGSSMGGYYALCASEYYDGPIWCINPVHDIIKVIRQLAGQDPIRHQQLEQGIRLYADFDQQVFRQLHPHDGQLHFALSTDDEVLGCHQPLLDLFPNHAPVIWKDDCGHRFFKFSELEEAIRRTLN